MIKTPSAGRRQPVGYLQSVVELNPEQLKTNLDHRLELDFNPKQPYARKRNTLSTGPLLLPCGLQLKEVKLVCSFIL